LKSPVGVLIKLFNNISGFVFLNNNQLEINCEFCGQKKVVSSMLLTFLVGDLTNIYNYDDYVGAWHLRFTKCIVDSQEFGSDNEHMNSRVFFSISKVEDIEGVEAIDLECTVRQPAGESYSYESAPIEVDIPEELKRKINYSEFRDAIEKYFKSIISKDGALSDILGKEIIGNNATFRIDNSSFAQGGDAVIHGNISQGHGGW
jgi:hypothetical protein